MNLGVVDMAILIAQITRQMRARGSMRGRLGCQQLAQQFDRCASLIDVICADDDAVIPQKDHLSVRPALQRTVNGSSELRPRFLVIDDHPRQAISDALLQNCLGIDAHEMGEQFNRVQMHYHALWQQCMQQGLDGWA